VVGVAGGPVCDAERQRCVCLHMHMSMITYRLNVHRSRPIGASLLAGRGRPGADTDWSRCACLTQGLAGRGDSISAASTGGVLVIGLV